MGKKKAKAKKVRINLSFTEEILKNYQKRSIDKGVKISHELEAHMVNDLKKDGDAQ